MAEIDVRGDIIPNDDKWIYRWLDWDSTCPKDVKDALENKPEDEKLVVKINSGGGSVTAGQEIYSMLRGRNDVEIEIQSMAGSAAGVIAMAGYCRISPVAALMIHNVQLSGASGDYHDMQKNAEILKQLNSALSQAFVEKTGKTEEEILKLMDRETWLTANQAVSMGFVDEIIRDEGNFTNAIAGMRLTDELRQQVIKEREDKEKIKSELLEDLNFYGV